MLTKICLTAFALVLATSTAQTRPASKCTFSVNAIERPDVNGFGIYVEGIAFDCRDKQEALDAIKAGLGAIQRNIDTSSQTTKQCYEMPTFKVVGCDTPQSRP